MDGDPKHATLRRKVRTASAWTITLLPDFGPASAWMIAGAVEPTAKNQHSLSADELAECNAAVAEYNEGAVGGSGDDYDMALWTGHTGQVSVAARVWSGASWGRPGSAWPPGRGSNAGRKAADVAQVSRRPVGTCAGTRSPSVGSNWFESGPFFRVTGSKCRIRGNWAHWRAT